MRHELFIAGAVKGQGSMTLWRAPDGSERAKHPPATIQWRNLVCGRLTEWWAGKPPIRGAVRVSATAMFGRPKGHFGSGRNAGVVKPSSPLWHTSYPDGDKVLRLIDDALVIAGVVADDSQVAYADVRKYWAEADERPGVLIVVEEL